MVVVVGCVVVVAVVVVLVVLVVVVVVVVTDCDVDVHPTRTIAVTVANQSFRMPKSWHGELHASQLSPNGSRKTDSVQRLTRSNGYLFSRAKTSSCKMPLVLTADPPLG